MEAGKKPAVFVFTTAYHPFIGGAEIAVQEVAKRLKGEFDFFIFTARLRRDLPRREARPEGTIIRVGVGGAVDKWLFLLWGVLSALGERRRLRGRRTLLWGMDISAGSGVAAVLNFLIPKPPFVFTVQYGYGEERIERGRFGLINRGFRFMLRRADALTAISTYLADIARRYGCRRPVEVIPNGVSVEQFRAAARQRKNQPGATVITVGRLVPKNAVDTLIRAIAVIKPNIPAIRCHILGDGPERQALEALACSLKVESAIQFFGSVPYEAVPQRLAAADVFVRASRSEGMGNAFVEALAAGLPIIGTPVGGINDIIRDGQTGLFCRVDDPRDLAQKIERLLNDRELAGRIVTHGQAMVAERFSWDSIARSYGQTFERLFEQPSSRILIATGIFPPDIGGPATYSQLLVRELPKRSFDVHLLTYADAAESRIRNQESRVRRVSRGLPKGIRHVWYFIQCWRFGLRAGIIYAQDTVSAGLPAMLAAKLTARAFVIRVAGDYAWEQGVERFGIRNSIDDFQRRRGGRAVEMLRFFQSWVAKGASAVIVPSRYLGRMVEGWGVSPERIRVIYNAVEASALMPRAEARALLGIPPDAPLVLSSGRLVPWKGFPALLAIMPDLLTRHPAARLVIAGDGPEYGALLGEAERLGIMPPHFELAGWMPRDALRRYLAAADVFVLNTAYEGFSHQVLESMAAGLPVLTTPAGGNAELVADGENGLLFPYNDQRALLDKLCMLLEDAKLRRRLAAAGRRTAAQFSPERMLAELIFAL